MTDPFSTLGDDSVDPTELVPPDAETVSLGAATQQCVEALSHRPCGLFTDFDGTLSPLAATPDAAVIHPTAQEALRRLHTALDFVAIVTGRSAMVAEGLVGLPQLFYVGNHGLERRHLGAHTEHPAGIAASRGVTDALVDVAEAVRTQIPVDGLLFEDKRLSGSIHYRLVDDPDQARIHLLKAAQRAAERHDLLVSEGRRIVELRPRAPVNKGTAILELIEERALKSVLFFGDDVTDIDGFRALRAHREQTDIAALTIGVASPESPAALGETSDIIVHGVDACADLLAAIADALSPADDAT
ncbi:MAG: trehalose-phosphatase [Chloroflexota bacterium]|nr:trehalose-phosphatase [Chloroflexota bacterium]